MDRLLMMEAFVRVVDAGSFSAAARSWGRSKAVVSKYVARLEAHLDAQLLRRTTRSLSLTDAGRDYHGRCVALLGELESMEASVTQAGTALSGALRVSVPPGFALTHLPLLTSDFIAKHPAITLDLDFTHRMVDLIGEGIDVAVRVTEPRDSTLVVRHLAPAPIVAVASKGYLRRRGTPKTPADLRKHDCIVDTNFRDQHRWRFRDGGSVAVHGAYRVSSPIAVRELATAGHGIALCPAFMVTRELAKGRLVEVLPGQVGFDWKIVALFPRRRFLSGRVRAYVDHLAVALGEARR